MVCLHREGSPIPLQGGHKAEVESKVQVPSLSVFLPCVSPEVPTSAALPAWASLQKQRWKTKEISVAKADLREGPELGWSLHTVSLAPENLQQTWSPVRRTLGGLWVSHQVLSITCLLVGYSHPWHIFPSSLGALLPQGLSAGAGQRSQGSDGGVRGHPICSPL